MVYESISCAYIDRLHMLYELSNTLSNMSCTHIVVNGYIINNIAYRRYEMILLRQDYKRTVD